MSMAAASATADMAAILLIAVADITPIAVADITPIATAQSLRIQSLSTTGIRHTYAESLSPLPPLRLLRLVPLLLVRLLRWRVRLALSQGYSNWQSLLVEPLLPVHWLLLSPNGWISRKAEALVLDGGFLLSRRGDAWTPKFRSAKKISDG